MKRPSPFAAVLFDMDGVLIDNTELHHHVWRRFTQAHGLHLSEEQVAATDGIRAAEVIAHLFSQRCRPEELARLLAERQQLYLDLLRSSALEEVAGAGDFLRELRARAVPCVLATSAAPANVEIVVSRLGLADLFDARVTAADVRRGKPDPEVYLTAAAAVAVPPERCLVVEDALPGIAAARAAGARCLGITSSVPADILLAHGADWVAADFRHLPEILRLA